MDDAAELPTALALVRGRVVGVDVERADSHQYFRRSALVQIGDADHCVLVDGVTLPQMPEVEDFLADRLAVLHAIHNDLDPLAAGGVAPSSVADTAVAAAMLGMPTGLGALLDEVLGVSLSEDKDRFQRADWAARPLEEDMAEYAAGDVFHLPALWQELADRLDAAGRREWYDQTLADVIAHAGEDTRDWTRTRGAGRLSPQQRAIVRCLWDEREAVAREYDIAPNRLLRDKTMVDLAVRPASGPDELVRRNQRRRGPLRDHAERLFAAQQEGREGPPEARTGGRRWSDDDRAAFDRMRKARAGLADELGIDAGVLCPSRPLRDAVAGEPDGPDELTDLAGLLPWQAEVLRETLWEAYIAEDEDEDEDAGDDGSLAAVPD